MSMNLKNFNLLKEDDTSYHLCSAKGKPFIVEKAKLNAKAHEVIKTLKSATPQKMAEGGTLKAEGIPGITQEEILAKEELPLETPLIAPDEVLIGGMLAAPAKEGLKAVGKEIVESQAGKADLSALKTLYNDFIETVMSKTGKLPEAHQAEIMKLRDQAIKGADEIYSHPEMAKWMANEGMAEARLLANPAAKVLRQNTQKYLNLAEQGIKDLPPVQAKACGGEVQRFKEGGMVEDGAIVDEAKQRYLERMAKSEVPVNPSAPSVDVGAVLNNIQTADQAARIQGQENAGSFLKEPPLSVSPSQPVSVAESSPIMQQGGNVAPISNADITAATQAILPAQVSDPAAGYGLMERAAKEQMTANNTIYNDAQKKLDAIPTRQEIYNKYEKADKEFQKAVEESKVDPSRLYNNASTGNKILAGLGMLLGGVGSGLTGKDNLAVKTIDDAIQRDIEAQREDRSNKMNLWKMNREKLGSDLAANAATENQILAGVDFKLRKTEGIMKGKEKIATAQMARQMIADKQAQNRMLIAAMSDNSDDLGGAGAGTEQGFQNKIKVLDSMKPEAAKEKREMYLPGLGTTKIKPTGEDRRQITTADTMVGALSELQALATKGPTAWGSVADSVNQTKMQAIQFMMKDAYKLGVLSKDDYEKTEKMIANPGSVRTDKAIAQLQATIDATERQKNGVLKQLGFTPFSSPSPETRIIEGVPYVKVPGGWKKAQ